MSVVRGRPPGLAGGISGTRKAYCSSLRACPAPKSPTKVRLSAVHMTRLQQGSPLAEPPTRLACAPAHPSRIGFSNGLLTEAGESQGRERRLGLLLGFLGVVVFSLSLPVTRRAVQEIDATFVAFGRMALAGLTAALILTLRRAPFPARHDLPALATV